ncbi:transposable element Tc1 transposase [Trichonephila clavipes]|nr:transposable element Tc1 transposase [Trichonephila clavipes]
MTEKMPREGIQAHHEQMPEFERSRLIELKEADWNHADWGRIVFSDESRFQLCPDDHRGRVWRNPGQRADPAFTIARHTGPQPGVIVWSAISFGNVHDLARQLEKMGQEISQETLRVLYHSMPRRVTACIQAREKMFVSRSFPRAVTLLKNKHVPLPNLGGFKLRSRISSQPIFNRRLCGGIPDISKEFKNSVGKFTVLFSSPIVLIDLKGIGSP